MQKALFEQKTEVSGAKVLIDASVMVKRQAYAFRQIMEGVREVCMKPDDDTRAPADREYIRPRQVYLLDGARGSGKTSTLLTICHFLKVLAKDKDEKKTEAVQRKLLDDMTSSVVNTKTFDQWAEEFPSNKPLVLRMVNTADLDPHKSPMEAQLSFIEAFLQDKLDAAKTANNDADRRQAERILKTLRQRVAKGWYLARHEGREALARDSASFNHYIDLITQNSASLHQRVNSWRDFVDEFLKAYKYKCLVIAFDDADVNPEVTEEIIHTVRIFMDHPRIVTLLASSLRTIRGDLLRRRYEDIGPAVRALGAPLGAVARDMRDTARMLVEEYLEKVLPRSTRIVLTVDRPLRGVTGIHSKADTGRNDEPPSDFQRIFGGLTFDDFCTFISAAYRLNFVKAKVKAHERLLSNRLEAGPPKEQQDMENFISWWLFRHWYGNELLPRSIRPLKAFKDIYAGVAKTGNRVRANPHTKEKPPHAQRLSVALFENSGNFPFISRVRDTDDNFLIWLTKQELSASWIGHRNFTITGWEIPENDYAYDYLRYRIDLGFAIPIRLNRSLVVPKKLLPTPGGYNLHGWGDFYEKVRPRTRLGIASALNHSVIPSNCLYTVDLVCLPDTNWQSNDPKEVDLRWDWHLQRDWSLLFYSQRNQTQPTPNKDLDNGPFNKAKEGLQNLNDRIVELGKDFKHDGYLINVVFPLASLATSQVIQKTPISSVQERKTTLLERENGGLDYYSNVRRIISESHIKNYEHLPSGPHPTGRLRFVARDVLTNFFAATPKLAPKEKDRRLHDFVCYELLVNDLRRAWLACRILLNQLPEAVKGDGIRRPGQPTAQDPDGLSSATFILDSSRRKALFARDDRFLTSIGIRYVLERWFGPAESLLVSLSRCVGLRDDTAKFERWLTGDFEPGTYLKDRIELRQKELFDAAESYVRENKGPLVFSKVIDFYGTRIAEGLVCAPELTGDAFVENTIVPEAANMGRVLRAFLIFLYGFSSTLPSLIHLEVSNIFFNGKSIGLDEVLAKNAAEEAIKCWENLIYGFLSFVRWFEDYLELVVLRLELYPKDISNSVRLTTIPDFAYATLGIGGRQGFACRVVPDLSSQPESQSELDSSDDKKAEPIVRSIFFAEPLEDGRATEPYGEKTELPPTFDWPEKIFEENINYVSEDPEVQKAQFRQEAFHASWAVSIFGETQINLIESLRFLQKMENYVSPSPSPSPSPPPDGQELPVSS